MSQQFDWKEPGLNRARFEALTKLLRLRHQGQVEPPTRFDNDEDDDSQLAPETDCSSVKASPPTDFEADRLRRQFLDRLAELIANHKGGRHVAATAMSVGPDSVKVTVAKNDKFRQIDREFIERVQSLLQRIAATTQDGSTKDALWAALLMHSESRIQSYLVDVRQLLKRYQQHYDTAHQRVQVDTTSLDSELSELCVAVFGQHPSTASRNDALVTRAHAIHKMFSSADFESLGFPASASLRTALGYLGRPRTSFHALPWSVAQTFRQLGQPLTDDQVHSLLGSNGRKARWTKARLLQEFGKLRSPTWEVHAEMQLLQHCILAAPSDGRMVPYFGCSKRSCFLCWSFLDLFQGFKSRGCHGKLYNLWGLPTFEGAKAEDMRKVAGTVRGLESLLTKEILHGNDGAPTLAKESTIGPSSIHTTMPTYERPGLVNTVMRYLDNQRLNVLFPATDSGRENAYEDSDTAMASNVENEVETNTDANEGPCGNFDCEKRTTRRCSRCHGRRYCSLWCEEDDIYSHKFECSRGAITTADLLERDCYADELPKDPQVREDFGFTRCRNKTEESHLFGVYQGILKILDVTAAEMHSWRMEGILTEKIIETFSARPEGSRGGYYPWFLRNKHVLDERHKVVRDEDDPALNVQRMLSKARPYLSASDQNTPVDGLVPWAKQNCFLFLALLLDSAHPPPTMPNLDLWYDFGFPVCTDPHAESTLASLYKDLLLGNRPIRDYFSSLGSTHFTPADFPTCPFEQFWKAWEAGTLMDLFDTYGTHGGRTAYGESIDARFPDLREFLSYPGVSESDMRFSRPSVWRLRQFLAVEGANVLTTAPSISRAAIEYGFGPGLDVRTQLDLHAFYTRIFQRGVRTGEVDGALRRGRLDEVAEQWYGEPVHERVRVVLRAVSEAGRTTVSTNVGDGSNDDRDMHDMWRLRDGHYEGEEHGEEGSHTGRDHGGGEDESTGREQSESLGNETRGPGWCTIQ
ncbi:hypothetical protein B0H66DRAFT_474160 [Apodospora peruviana]|uniref:MYND-type domain-containing protein n=1 Tax=Apodospora peruviana TaxID=516989 RepID=A0AAE0M8G6_9PEZI|nr:hypothetical protein B0H66DRAFT_474160 [Apodospora peruviana]